MIADEDRGPIGRWLRDTRRRHHYKSTADLVKDLRAHGIPTQQSVLATLEAHGKVDTEGLRDLVQKIGVFLNSPPPELSPTITDTDLVSALLEQTRAIGELTRAIHAERQARVEWETGLLSALRQLVAEADGAGAARSGDPSRGPLAGAPG